jgi:hypothetical protein
MSKKSWDTYESSKLIDIMAVLMLIALIVNYIVLSNYCENKCKDDPSLIADVDEILHKDPIISNALRNNTYTISIVKVNPHIYIDEYLNIECKPRRVTAEVRLKKPVFMVLYGPVNKYYETRVIRVMINFDNWTVISYENKQPGYAVGYTSP